ncbi:hypothetical protein MBM09_01530 [Flaviramulus sp. BrNp1-15]|uniref:hypothetical protein n=1 Tax=Flaviramulus sp. BrNp1-15 TaxID=2916754 RepID=UPI001EE89BFE|nr:hypothetical protein [Flaviramulus sp. BrNp1-15]ULC59670.1 hypothetical protein MBM09_01530 [Flaviramulus sp. BrNp1-15]
MNNKIIENILFDEKINDEFYVIKDKEKLEKNLIFVKNTFDLIVIEEGYNYGYVHLEYENNIYLSFCNEYGFRLDFLILNITTEINREVIKYLSNNVEDEIRRTMINIYENSNDF